MRYSLNRSFVSVLFASFAIAGRASAQNGPIHLAVDATDASRKILHARITIPVKPGPLALRYPKWIPGEHGPNGPIANLTGLSVTAAGKVIPWRRDDIDLFAIRVDVPEGVTTLDVSYDYLIPGDMGPYAEGPAATSELAVLNWNLVVLYPAEARSDDLTYIAKLKTPPGWKWATSLPVASSSENVIEFKPATLTTLVDSPLSMGKHFRAIPLGTSLGRDHEVDLVADSDAALNLPEYVIAGYKQLVPETAAVFGARHYRQYRFLLTMSDHLGSFGVEHHESSDDRIPERMLIAPAQTKSFAILWPHEFFHSWNGKFRRPSGLATGDYHTPMKGELLWVYEGLTDYYGGVLAARTGLFAPQDYRDYLAALAAQMDNTAGRKWRPLADTAVSAPFLYLAPGEWRAARRGTDFYPEMDLIWLEADTLIRQKTNGAKSLDDFCRAFHGGEPPVPAVKPYTLDDVIAGLNAVLPYDWRGFLNERIYTVQPRAPLGGIEASGWKLVYTDQPNELTKEQETARKSADFAFSLGISLGDVGAVADIVPESPCAKAGMSPGQKLIGVNGRKYSSDILREALKAAKGSAAPIELIVEDGEYFHTYRIDYHEGERYPHLERVPAVQDLLSEVIKPRAK
jgi:predicted metalloprotease with PDZ domain